MTGVPLCGPLQPIDHLVARHRQAFGAQIRLAIQEGVASGTFREYLTRLVEHGMIRDVETLGVGWLPILACEACGADGSRTLPIAAAWQLIRLAVKLLDDVEDGDCSAIGSPGTIINAATALLFVAQVAAYVSRDTGLKPSQIQRTTEELHRALLVAASGQHRDLEARTSAGTLNPDEWLAVSAAKSGALLRWAVVAGTLAAGARRGVTAALGEFGLCLGILLQLADDFTDCWRSGAEGDLAAGHLTLPVCYAFWVAADDEAARLERLLQARRQGASSAAGELEQMLIDMGAQAYLLTVALAQRAQALAALDRATSELGENVQLLLKPLIDCVFPAFRGLGV